MALLMNSSLRAEEIVHKLLKQLGPVLANNESLASSMVLEACTHQKIYNKVYAMVAERLCKVNGRWQNFFSRLFTTTFENASENSAMHNVHSGRFFAHLFRTGAIPWSVLSVIKLSELQTESAIFAQHLLVSLLEGMGQAKLSVTFNSPTVAPHVQGILQRDTPENMRFTVNLLEQFGVGFLGDGIRAALESQRKRPREE